MALDLTELKKIRSSQKNLVFGYFRDAHQQLLPQNEPYYDIQALIVYTCLAFYYIKHEWDTENVNSNVEIDGDFIKNKESDDSTTVLKEEIMEGIHEFKFKIINYDYDYGGLYYDIGFGIIPSEYFKEETSYITDSCFGDRVGGYVYFGSTGKSEHNRTESDYGTKCKLDDIVTMIVDLENYQIKYKVNDFDYGVAFSDVEHAKYRIAVYLYEKGSEVEIIH